MTDRQLQLHCARVYLAEAGRRRHHPQNKDFYWTLMGMVAGCRRKAAAMREPSQAELFA
ncbi:hypothetical protein [Rhodanobacter fulvus]|uniref:hypothetical protein n=1 Tax=Rhodanobacter fulvus TaxID=219571 RepID=UPI0012E9D92D|nr:hypothetical protein [Rhodanobacter fulvus]